LKSITSTDEDEFMAIMKVNVTAPYRLANLTLPNLKVSKG